MTEQARGRQKDRRRRGMSIFMLSVALVVLLLGIGLWLLAGRFTGSISLRSVTPGMTATAIPSPSSTRDWQVLNGAVSPLIFGTNLSLLDSNDQFLNSADTRSQLQRMHVRIIRMPVRPSLANETEIQAAQAIKSLAALAVVNLRGAIDAMTLADDIRIVKDMNSVFGNGVVFYEYGNEEDLLGIDVKQYIQSWNSIVPQLKRVALDGHFIGPVNYRYDQSYLMNFLQHASPRPDEVSWHEYTCDITWSNQLCISRIDRWTGHIRDARHVMLSTIGSVLPIMITEWNYAANATASDGKITDGGFMSAWTARALETLAANRVFAAMQYACTDSIYALVRNDGSISAQGLTIKNTYEQMITAGQQPTAVPIPTSGR